MRIEETDKELELSEKDVFLKYNKGKTYGNDLFSAQVTGRKNNENVNKNGQL